MPDIINVRLKVTIQDDRKKKQFLKGYGYKNKRMVSQG